MWWLCYFVFGILVGIIRTDQNINQTIHTEFRDDDVFYPSLEWSDVFDWKVLTVLSEKSVNVLFSPASLKLVLGILYEGSSGATQRNFENSLQFLSKNITREKMKQTIESLNIDPENENKLNLSTRIFLHSGYRVKQAYAKKIKKFYNADVVSMDFNDSIRASEQINKWAAESTFGAIPQLTDSDEVQDMIMLLANAIYFKGVWIHQFPKNATCVAGFYATPYTRVYVPFMTSTNIFYYFESEFLEAKILRLPYKNSNFSMFFILPLSIGGLPSLIENINLLNLHRELHYLDKKPVLVSIPKFSFKLKASFTDVLQKFDLHKIFQNSASFTGIVEGNSSVLRELVVSDVLQSSGISVDEMGSIAFAATDVTIGNKIGVPINVFNASHPFLFFVQDDVSGTILFLGKIENPVYQDLEIRKEHDDLKEDLFVAPLPGILNSTYVK